MNSITVSSRLLSLFAVLMLTAYAPSAQASQHGQNQLVSVDQPTCPAGGGDCASCKDCCDDCAEDCQCCDDGSCTCEDCKCCADCDCCKDGTCTEGCGCCDDEACGEEGCCDCDKAPKK